METQHTHAPESGRAYLIYPDDYKLPDFDSMLRMHVTAGDLPEQLANLIIRAHYRELRKAQRGLEIAWGAAIGCTVAAVGLFAAMWRGLI